MGLIQGQISAGQERSARLDKMTHGLITIDYAHHEIHDGSHYYSGISDQLTQTSEHIDISLATPGWTPSSNDDYDTTFHLVISNWFSQACSFQAWEDVSSVSGGTVVVPQNHNRNTLYHNKTSKLTVTRGALARTGGTSFLGPSYMGLRSEVHEARNEAEFILKPASLYVFRLTQLVNGANNCGIRAEWYETTPKH